MAYQFSIEGADDQKAAVSMQHRGTHSYLNLMLDGGLSATVRIGTVGARLCVYADRRTTERAYRVFSFEQAGAVTTWIANDRELGGGHWLHTFQLDDLMEWARVECQRVLTDIGNGRLKTDRMQEGDTNRLYSSEEVALELGITQRRVQQLATSRGVGRPVGRSLVFRPNDIEALRERSPGRPRKEA